MAKNKMAQVAQLFGKKLNEPFTIKGERYIFGESAMPAHYGVEINSAFTVAGWTTGA